MIKIVVAIDKNNVIGKDNKMPWNISDEMEVFKRITLNKTILMGQYTFDNLEVKPLRNRKTIVLSSDKNYQFSHKDVSIVYDYKKIINEFKKEKDIYISGGEQIYKLFLPYADEIYISKINKSYDGDKYFIYNEKEFNIKEILVKNKEFTTYILKRIK